VPVVVFTDRPDVAQTLTLWHSIFPILLPIPSTTDEAIASIDEGVRRLGLAGSGDRVIIVGATPRSVEQRSVFLEIHRVR
jgi:pyruvate kinase